MNDNYTYSSITVTTKLGKKYDYDYCDYYIQDNVLTVFRKETFQKGYSCDEKTYRKFESHFPWENVENLKCINK